MILALESGGVEQLAELRRRIHTTKGEAGMIGLDSLSGVCHAVEDFLDDRPVTSEAIDRLLQIKDWIGGALAAYAEYRLPHPTAAEVVSLLSFERTVDPAEPAAAFLPEDPESLALIAEFARDGRDGLSHADRALLADAQNGPAEERSDLLCQIFHALRGMAGLLDLTPVESLARAGEGLLARVRQEEVPLTGGVLDLALDATAMMGALFGAVERTLAAGGGAIPAHPNLPVLLARLRQAAEGAAPEEAPLPEAPRGAKIGQILQRPPFGIPADAVEKALRRQEISGRRLGEELIDDGEATAKDIARALRVQQQSEGGAAALRETVKIDVNRLEAIMEMVGELVIVEAMVVHDPAIAGLKSLRVNKHLAQLAKITRDLQDVSMGMRMVPVRGVFQKMSRLVRDLARKSGKDVAFFTEGEATEMDRGMVEKLSDPLIHMIRNALDHGVETPEERAAAGKPPRGTVKLSACHEGGNIVVEVADDGRGLDRAAILQKAVRQGLVQENDTLGEQDIYNLIFMPGFSTATQVTAISGRGVGMDVVKRNVETMRGRVGITSAPGQGSTFRLILPLTLAIIDGMLVACGSEQFIIPTLSIVESLKPSPQMLVTLGKAAEFINLRGEILPLVRLGALFNIPDARADATDALVVVIETMERRICVLVDEVLTQQQVVIKSMGSAMHEARHFSGAAIMSDGRVGLILNTDEIARGRGTHRVAAASVAAGAAS
jgi:two-component system chemotaxis sensor kinase CheA